MTLRNADRCRDTSTTTGTGNLTVSGSPPQSYITFNQIPGITVGDTFWLIIANQNANEYESTLGTWQGSNVISRAATPYQSSNGGALVNFSAGTKDVFIAPVSSQLVPSGGSPLTFGDGSDGNVTISSGTTTLTRDMFYNNLTLSGTGVINPSGYRIFVAGTLDISAAPAGAIARNGANATDATGSSAGFGGAALSSGTVGGSLSGVNGVPNGTTTGAASSSGNANGGAGGAGGGGGNNASVGTNGSIGAATRVGIAYELPGLNISSAVITGGIGGGGGGGGANSGLAGGQGGGGGAGGGVIVISAKTIARGTNSTAGVIQAIGGNGSLGSTGAPSNAGGGGGGAGGGGGWVFITYNALSGSTITNGIDISGGGGGGSGSGAGGYWAGSGGGSGSSGAVLMQNIAAGTLTYTAPVAGASGTTSTGATAVGGASQNTQRVSL